MARRLTQIAGFVAEGDVPAIDWAMARGQYPSFINELNWPLPPGFRFQFGASPERVIATDRLVPFRPGLAFLRPPSLLAGIHPAPNARSKEIEELITATLASHKLARSSIAAIATIDHAGNDRCLRRLGYPIRAFTAQRLDRVRTPNSSRMLRDIVGSRSVCEAAALVAAGRGATLLVERTRSHVGTIAIARRLPPQEVVIEIGTTPPNARARPHTRY